MGEWRKAWKGRKGQRSVKSLFYEYRVFFLGLRPMRLAERARFLRGQTWLLTLVPLEPLGDPAKGPLNVSFLWCDVETE